MVAHLILRLFVAQIAEDLLFISWLLFALGSCFLQNFILLFFWLIQITWFISIAHRCILPCACVLTENILCICCVFLGLRRHWLDSLNFGLEWSWINSCKLYLIEINRFIHEAVLRLSHRNWLLGYRRIEFPFLNCNTCWRINTCAFWCLWDSLALLARFTTFGWLYFDLLLHLTDRLLILL